MIKETFLTNWVGIVESLSIFVFFCFLVIFIINKIIIRSREGYNYIKKLPV